MCFYVGRRRNKVWFWYVYDRWSKSILCWHLGGHFKRDGKQLLSSLNIGNIRCFFTDDLPAYGSLLPQEKHIVSKKYTQTIERQNSNFRKDLKRLNRETVNFSRSFKVLNILISLYIEKHLFKPFL